DGVTPSVQLSYGGLLGVIQGKYFRMGAPEDVLVSVPRLLARALLRRGRHLPVPLRCRTFDDYVRTLSAIAPLPRGVHAAFDATAADPIGSDTAAAGDRR